MAKSNYTIIPAVIRGNPNLLKFPRSILLYAEILALSKKLGYCYASNRWFSEKFNVTIQTITKELKLLKTEKVIEVETERKGVSISKRKIYPLYDRNSKRIKRKPQNDEQIETNILPDEPPF